MGYFTDNPNFREPQFGELTAESLARALHAIGGRDRESLVILDVPMPTALSHTPFSEAVEQLYARNQFAQLLANTGEVSAVLGAGLGMSAEILIPSLVEAERLVDIPLMIRGRCLRYFAGETHPELRLQQSWGPMGAALFMAEKRFGYTAR
jgi:hypothetical protein